MGRSGSSVGALGLACLLMLSMPSRGQTPALATPETKRPARPDNVFGALSFTSGREPIAVSADGLEFDYKAGVITYRGAVKATQGDMTLEADRLTITLADMGAGQLREVVASGHVRLAKGERWATAGEAVFDQRQRTAILRQGAVLHDGASRVEGDRIVVYLDEERSVVEGARNGGRVSAVLVPPSQQDDVP